jgi:putative ABC transport system ATP-binding protein
MGDRETVAAPVLEAEGLVRRFQGGRGVVRGVSIAIRAAESVSLVGPSGCGKTTLLSMLGLLDRPDEGRVRVAGHDAWSLGSGARAALRLAAIGFVFQQNNLLPHLDARDNVALPAWHLGGSRQRALAAADALLDRFGLTARARTKAAALSTGEAQRAAIARALINGPKLVLADEPTGALDSESAHVVLEALDEVRRSGAALLVVTHDKEVAARADRRLAMRDGLLTDNG